MNEIFVIGSWIDTEEKKQILIDAIKEIKLKGFPICLVSHYPISDEIQKLVDYYIYEKENVLSVDYRLTFNKIVNGVIVEQRESPVDYHGVACLMNIRNAVDFLLAKGKYKYIHYREADLIYDLDTYMSIFKNTILVHDMEALFFHFQEDNYRTDLFSVDIEWFNNTIPRVQTWEEYKNNDHGLSLVLEYWVTHQIRKFANLDEIIFVRFFQTDSISSQIQKVEW